MKTKKDFFISYRNGLENEENNNNLEGGKNIAKNFLYKPLKEKGYEAHYDPDNKELGEYPERLERAVRNCKVFLWVLSEGCLECKAKGTYNDWYMAELLWALKYNREIIPIISPGFQMPKPQYIHQQFENAFRTLKLTEKLNNDDEDVLKKVFELCNNSINNHKECIFINADFDIDDVIDITKRAGIRVSRYKRLKQKIVLFIIVFLMIVCIYKITGSVSKYLKNYAVWDGNHIVEGGWESIKGEGTASDPYQITNAAELAWLSYTSQSVSYENTYFQLKEDIKLNQYENGIRDSWSMMQHVPVNEKLEILNTNETHLWTPIGSEEHPFAGHFDGGGHIIYGLFISAEQDYQGLFGYCSESSVIEDLSVVGANLSSTGQYIGVVAGKSLGLINKCNVVLAMIHGNSYIGGIAGRAHIISNSFSSSWISSDNGIHPEGSNRSFYGGVAGYCDYVINSSASTYFELNGVEICGGLVGELTADAYNCIVLMAAIISGDNEKMLMGDTIGQYDGLANKGISNKNLYYTKNNQSFNYHDYYITEDKKNVISELIDTEKDAAYIMNENIDSNGLEFDSDIYSILLKNGVNNNDMELVKWKNVNSNLLRYARNLVYAPMLETTLELDIE